MRSRRLRRLGAGGVVVLLAALFSVSQLGPARAANPPSGTIDPASAPLTWVGTAITPAASAGENTCVEGVNCDSFILTVAPADWTGKIVRARITWSIPATDYDLYIHKCPAGTPTPATCNAGPTVSRDGGGAPDTDEEASIDPTADGTGAYSIHVVYFSVAAGDQYSGNASVQPKPVARSATYVKGGASGISFSPSVTVKAPVAARDGEPSNRTDSLGNFYTSAIRGVPAGVDLWYVDLPNDPYMRNWTYRGQPDTFTCDADPEACAGADGGGDVDLAVSLADPVTGAVNNPPTLAGSSLVLANISCFRSSDKGVTFTRNPLCSSTGGLPVDDRQWQEFYGKDSVYLLYRLVDPAITQIQRSDDGGLTYGPAVTAGAIGQVGYVDVHQKTGTVYVSGSTGQVCAGTPPNTSLPPTTYVCHPAGPSTGAANIFFVVKVADDGTPNGTVYVAYSNGHDIFLAHSFDKGDHWSQPVRVSDGAETKTSLMPWLETGPTPGSVGVVWYGTSNAGNDDSADWKVFYAQTYDATADVPTFRQVEASDHFIHASNISTGGLLGTANRNLLDYFQVSFDPNGAAVIAYTDDHNDFNGHTFITHQIGGPALNSTKGNLPPAPPAPPPTPAPADGSQVTDFAQDAASGRGLVRIPANDPLDIVSIKYSCEGGATDDPFLVAQMKVSDLATIPAGSYWRMNFAANAPFSTISPTGEYSFGLSDRGDQFFVLASTDPSVSQFSFGTATRQSDGSLAYTTRGAADSGSFDSAARAITVKVALSKLNPYAVKGAIAPGSVLVGLRGQTFQVSSDAKRDLTRGGTQYAVGCAPAADLAVTQTDSPDPARVGQALTYTVTVRNIGPSAAQGVTLVDTLPKNAGYGSASASQGSCSQKPTRGTVTCSLGTIAAGATATVRIVVKPSSKGTISNKATATATSPPDPNQANNTSVETTTVQG